MKTFLVRLLYKAQKALPFGNDLLSKIGCLFPSNFDENNLLILAKTYNNIIPSSRYFKFYEEVQTWEENLETLKLIFNNCNGDIISFFRDKRINETYEQIALLAKTLLIFPHSSAEAERLFSQLKCVKSVKRAQLNDDTLESLLLLKYNKMDFEKEESFQKVQLKHAEVIKKISAKKTELKRKSSQISSDVIEKDILSDKTNQEVKNSQERNQTTSHFNFLKRQKQASDLHGNEDSLIQFNLSQESKKPDQLLGKEENDEIYSLEKEKSSNDP